MRAYKQQLRAKAVEVKKYLPELCKENIFSSNSNIFTATPVEQKRFTNLYDLFHKDNVELNLHSTNWPINCSYKPHSNLIYNHLMICNHLHGLSKCQKQPPKLFYEKNYS